MAQKIVIAIDGYTACGKSTLARDLAEHLNYIHLDTGAMYRAVTLYFLRNEIDWQNITEVEQALSNINLNFRRNNKHKTPHIFLNSEEVEEEIRSKKVSRYVSDVSAIKTVRKALVKQQRQIGKEGGIVLDGRDIGTVVFPKAELKIFLTADFETRVDRRYQEKQQKDNDVNKKEVRENLKQRDYKDQNREESPLQQADDAVLIDNTHLSQKEQLEKAYQLAKEKINL